MPIDASEIERCAVYEAGDGQLRIITKIDEDENGNITHVHYQAKSRILKNRPFDYAHGKTQPPKTDTFTEACHRKLSEEDIRQLVIKGILTREELDECANQ